MRTIWKYELQPECSIDMPEGAMILSVREQGDTICLWAMVDPSAPIISRKFVSFCTGGHVPNDPRFIFLGTSMLDDGSLVFHTFESS